MKTLIASTAIALALAAPSFAQTQTPMNMNGGFVGNIENQALRTSDLLGARLYVSQNQVDLAGGLSPDWDDVGEISDIIIGGSGDIDAVLVDIGGFLGIGERTVAVNMDSLQFVSDGPDANDFFVVMQGDRASLEAAPEFNQDFARGRTLGTMNVGNEGSGLTTQNATGTSVAGEPRTNLGSGAVVDNSQTPATAVVTEGGTTVTTGGTDTAGAANTAAGGAVVTGNAGTNLVETTENAAEATGDAVTDAAEATADTAENALDATGDAVTDATSDVANATGGTVVTTGGNTSADPNANTAAATDGTVVTTGDTSTGMATTGGARMTAPNMTVDGYETVGLDMLTTEDVTGAPVYDVNDKRVGEIGELVMTSDGRLQDAVIDVGGFLGLGEKPVAVSFESMQILRGANDLRIYLDTTEDALTQLPAYEN